MAFDSSPHESGLALGTAGTIEHSRRDLPGCSGLEKHHGFHPICLGWPNLRTFPLGHSLLPPGPHTAGSSSHMERPYLGTVSKVSAELPASPGSHMSEPLHTKHHRLSAPNNQTSLSLLWRLKSEVRVTADLVPSEDWEKEAVSPFFPSCWGFVSHLWGSLCYTTPISAFMCTWYFPCVCLPLFQVSPFYHDTSHIWLGVHLTPVWHHFNLFNYTCNNPILVRSYSEVLGGRISTWILWEQNTV